MKARFFYNGIRDKEKKFNQERTVKYEETNRDTDDRGSVCLWHDGVLRPVGSG